MWLAEMPSRFTDHEYNERTTHLPKTRPRWLRFSLRTLLVVVTVLGVWLGVQVNPVRKQRNAVAWIQEVGGTVTYDYEIGDD